MPQRTTKSKERDMGKNLSSSQRNRVRLPSAKQGVGSKDQATSGFGHSGIKQIAEPNEDKTQPCILGRRPRISKD